MILYTQHNPYYSFHQSTFNRGEICAYMQERGTGLPERVYHVLRNLKVASKNQVVLFGVPRLPQPCPTPHRPHTRQSRLALGPFFFHFASWPRAWTGKGDMVQVMVIHRSEVRIRWLGSTPSWSCFLLNFLLRSMIHLEKGISLNFYELNTRSTQKINSLWGSLPMYALVTILHPIPARPLSRHCVGWSGGFNSL